MQFDSRDQEVGVTWLTIAHLRGLESRVPASWHTAARGPIKILLFLGGDFYINTVRPDVLQGVGRELTLFGMG